MNRQERRRLKKAGKEVPKEKVINIKQNDLLQIKKEAANKTAEILEGLAEKDYQSDEAHLEANENIAVNYAASILHRVASGELAEVVHAEWIKGYVCNNCFHHNAEGMTPVCPHCGAHMKNGKDDGHEK